VEPWYAKYKLWLLRIFVLFILIDGAGFLNRWPGVHSLRATTTYSCLIKRSMVLVNVTNLKSPTRQESCASTNTALLTRACGVGITAARYPNTFRGSRES
jgi:hypothetical protein